MQRYITAEKSETAQMWEAKLQAQADEARVALSTQESQVSFTHGYAS